MQLTNRLKNLDAHSRANKYADRIYSELLYLYHLNSQKALGWEDKLDRAMAYLEESVKENGAIIREDCENVEMALADLSDKAKEYVIHCVGHAHIDMNYQWGYQETVSITTETFRTMLTLMTEYPDFTFSQSQASVYEIVEKYDPAMLAEIRQRVQEGRWELAATQWVETDKNMPNGESLCRHIYYTKKCLADIFGIDPDTLRIDYEPDTFGHNASVPEILQDGGVDYYYHCRGIDPRGPYRWQSPSGKEVIAYSEPSWYQNAIDYRAFSYYPQMAAKWGDGNMKEFLKVYGLGDHGGGPSRIDLEKLVDMMGWPLFPTLKFSRYDAYFAYLDSIRDTLPVHVGELNFVFGGCYTSQSRLKMANRLAELRLYDAEMLTAQAAALTGKRPQISLDKAWQNTMFNQFHDILPGSCVIETKEAALGYFQDTIGYTNTVSVEALRNIAAEIDTSALPFDNRVEVKEGGGMGFRLDRERGYTLAMAERGHGNVRILHLFNTTAYDRDDAITVQLWDYPDDINNLTAATADGTPVPLQVISANQGYYCNSFSTVMLRAKVPALGYQTVIIKQRDEVDPNRFNLPATPGRRHDTFGDQNMLLENEYIRAEFDAETGTIVSLID
ncbi:MAG: alpha-mannosidase, partial [Clostridia bacterium]|nr:alpha-mannosidase [Clostridia bacterium]